MEVLTSQFKNAYHQEDGYGIAAVFTPSDVARLYDFHKSSNVALLSSDLRSILIYHNDLGLSKQEANAWINLFSEYWTAIGELLSAVDSPTVHATAGDYDWGKVYKAWRKVSDVVIKSFQDSLFPYWAVPLLTVAGKYLRVFALRADESARLKTGNVTYNEGFQDDMVSSVGKNENLADCGRQINRMFAACSSDRLGTHYPGKNAY
jgi:COP9 signalosome complex subunit 12